MYRAEFFPITFYVFMQYPGADALAYDYSRT